MRRLVRHLDAPLVAILAALACTLLAFLPGQMSPDGWYALLGGDVIVHHGLPHHDWLTVWGHGREWVDQQWLAQLAYYGLYSLGGLRLALLVNAGIVVGTFAAALALAGARGGAPRAVFSAAVLAALTIGVHGSALRPQTLALPLFLAVSWLLREDARARSSRVFLTIPLIALWGNLHGSAVLAVGLVFLHVAQSVWSRRTGIARNLCLGALAPAALFATPYAAHVAGYYRTILLNGDFARYVPDWMPTSLSAGTVAFYVLAALVVVGLARAPDSLTRFERWSLVALLVLAVEANRGVTWFALFALVTAPASWETVRLPSWRMPAAARTALVAASVLAVTVALGVAASRPRSWFTADYPRTAARAANVAAGPAGRVFANGAYADWLLVVEPTLRGRVAYDARFEVLPHGRLAQAAAVSIGRWDAPRILQPYDVVVLRPGESELRATLTRSGSWRRVAADRKVVVLERTGSRST